MSAFPVTSAARVTAVCSRGRPATRTSCLADPKRVEAPAASTTAYNPSATRPPTAGCRHGLRASPPREGERRAPGQCRANARVAMALLENRVGIDTRDQAPVGGPGTRREQRVDGVAPRAPYAVEELRKLPPALLCAAAWRRCGRARQGRFELLKRLAAAPRTRQHVLECAPSGIRGCQASVPQVAEALVALFEPREHTHEIVHAGLPEFLQRRAAAQRDGVATPECSGAGVGHGAGVLALRGELGPDHLNLVHEPRKLRDMTRRITHKRLTSHINYTAFDMISGFVASAASPGVEGRCRTACTWATIASEVGSGVRLASGKATGA